MKILNLIKKNLFLIIVLIYGIYWVYDYFSTQKAIENLDFGINANELRKSLNIPIIDESMSSDNGYRWESWREKPKQNEILHVWKNVTPSESKKMILEHEFDAYRKLNSDGKIAQFNIISEIIGDSVSMRSGKLFYFDSEFRNEINLNEREIDSVSRSWGLNYLKKK
ncbi:hypothetical protein [Aquimarina macrocephali]|uniref:hypothetical protein n=1 Tax=Aquimarina macrocephali TaxID=666563 RepID=UPI003F681776